MRVVVGLDAETAAGVLGKRAGAVRTAAYRGLRRLAEQLEAHADAGLPHLRQRTDDPILVAGCDTPAAGDA